MRRLERCSYPEAMQLQTQLVEARQSGAISDQLLLLEHEPVVTVSRRGGTRYLRVTPEELAARGISLYTTTRGGDITYHGPGQLVAYPILALEPDRRDLHRYLRDLEQVLLDTVAEFGVVANRWRSRTGIWVKQGKLASIGVRCSRWVTSHGVALNLGGELAGFSAIVACGLEDAKVTSLEAELGSCPPRAEVEERFCAHFGRIMNREIIACNPIAEP